MAIDYFLKQLRYVLIFVAFLTIFLFGVALFAFNYFFEVVPSHAVTVCGPGYSNEEKIAGDINITGVIKNFKTEVIQETISSGVLAYQSYYMSVMGEGGVNDDIDTISGGEDGYMLFLFPASAGVNITLKNGTGNLDIGGNISMNQAGDIVLLRKVGSSWKLVFAK